MVYLKQWNEAALLDPVLIAFIFVFMLDNQAIVIWLSGGARRAEGAELQAGSLWWGGAGVRPWSCHA